MIHHMSILKLREKIVNSHDSTSLLFIIRNITSCRKNYVNSSIVVLKKFTRVWPIFHKTCLKKKKNFHKTDAFTIVWQGFKCFLFWGSKLGKREKDSVDWWRIARDDKAVSNQSACLPPNSEIWLSLYYYYKGSWNLKDRGPHFVIHSWSLPFKTLPYRPIPITATPPTSWESMHVNCEVSWRPCMTVWYTKIC